MHHASKQGICRLREQDMFGFQQTRQQLGGQWHPMYGIDTTCNTIGL